MSALDAFVEEVGAVGPVAVEGGRTTWTVGGEPHPDARLVRAPVGVREHIPAEMTVRVGAGTTVEELHAALATHGQTTVLDGAPGATVGGVLAVGRSGLRRLRHGPVRDALLEARYVSAEGRLIVAGGPTVKNVTGYDLCRLLVGSLGTLGLLGEVVLRTRPIPEAQQWVGGEAEPEDVMRALYRPSAVLWDGTTVWALLEGYAVDVRDQQAVAVRLGLRDADGPPQLPPHRWSVPAAEVRATVTSAIASGAHVVAEVGVGLVHADRPTPPSVGAGAGQDGGAHESSADLVAELHRRLKAEFDPTGRLNPGRDPLRREVAA